MIAWGPPPVKAAGLWFAAQPGMDPLVYGVGAALASGWGHPDAKPDIFTMAAEGHRRSAEQFCDPLDPPWWC